MCDGGALLIRVELGCVQHEDGFSSKASTCSSSLHHVQVGLPISGLGKRRKTDGSPCTPRALVLTDRYLWPEQSGQRGDRWRPAIERSVQGRECMDGLFRYQRNAPDCMIKAIRLVLIHESVRLYAKITGEISPASDAALSQSMREV
jgi:hypothetical protein